MQKTTRSLRFRNLQSSVGWLVTLVLIIGSSLALSHELEPAMTFSSTPNNGVEVLHPQFWSHIESHLTPHAPILIDEARDFTAQNGVTSGSGTASDPYIIEGWSIDATGSEDGLAIFNTRKHVIIRNCYIQNAKEVGINIHSAWYVTIQDCQSELNGRGFNISDSVNITVRNNLIQYNQSAGITIFGSRNVELLDNQVYYNWEQDLERFYSWGIFIDPESQTSGLGNRISGHNSEIWIMKTTTEDSDGDGENDSTNIFEYPDPTPETSCTQVFDEFFLFIGEGPGGSRLSEPYCELVLAMFRSLPDVFRYRVTQVIVMGESDEAAGQYTGQGTVRIFASQRHLKAFSETLFHEVGHALHDSLFSESDWNRWNQLHSQSGSDGDNYAIQDADGSTRANRGLMSYGMRHTNEDFASLIESYTRDTPALVARIARIEAMTGKTILKEKVRFLVTLFRGTPFLYRKLVDWDSETGFAKVRIQRAPLTSLENGLPVIDDDLEWEEL